MERCSSLKKSLTLEYQYPKNGFDTDGNPQGDFIDKTMNVRLVLPGLGWSPHALDLGQSIASGIIFAGRVTQKQKEMTGAEIQPEESSLLVLGQGKSRSKIYALYYIGENEKVYNDTTADERIYAFENSPSMVTPEQEEEMFSDFLLFRERSLNSFRRSLEKTIAYADNDGEKLRILGGSGKKKQS